MFKINLDTRFSEIKKKCCDVWNLSHTESTLYDDGFNNLECCLNSLVLEFFYCYSPVDKTFKNGEICFYLIDRLKAQKEILEAQEKCK